jgi:hypothetical protein
MAFLSHIFNFGVLDGAFPTLPHLQWLSQLLYMLHESIFIRSFGPADTGMPEIQPDSLRPSGGPFDNITGCYEHPDAQAANVSWQYSHMSSLSPSSALSLCHRRRIHHCQGFLVPREIICALSSMGVHVVGPMNASGNPRYPIVN